MFSMGVSMCPAHWTPERSFVRDGYWEAGGGIPLATPVWRYRHDFICGTPHRPRRAPAGHAARDRLPPGRHRDPGVPWWSPRRADTSDRWSANSRSAGARAVGIAGSAEKCAFVQDDLRFDAAVNHRAADFPAHLAAACPNVIDVYVENVGGAI